MELAVTGMLFSQLALGVAINGFIVGTYLLEWRKKRSLRMTDVVLVCLAVNRFLWQLFHTLGSVFSFVQVVVTITYQVVYSVCAFLNWSGLWLASVLSVIHCVKISNYNNWLFINLKRRICWLVQWLLLANLLTSLAFTLALVWFTFPENPANSTDVSSQTNATVNLLQNIPSPLLVLCLGSLLPFIIFCVAVSLLINSLRIHVQQMRSRATGFQTPHLEAHIRVIKSMAFFLVLFLLYLVVTILGAGKKNVGNWLYFYLGMAFYPSLHSAVLIYSTRQLRMACLAIYYGTKKLICVHHGKVPPDLQ
ncbi:taste 2 receptor member 4 [Xenopus tropicalis]|uniref:Taste receptor type 2 n=1 Tax=Xenopus tropicalis TaxID=8364 RepID=Q2AB70_XENTR|nr:taste 2 receptor member 4 [Xenopus tropicalis]BAE80397.1 bitter taste receptor [Xenopus tropicalis]|eukprot:NP_001165528.1 bitter taste receptor 11 [Xenopus tropicalis]